jgi:hypothetical protein
MITLREDRMRHEGGGGGRRGKEAEEEGNALEFHLILPKLVIISMGNHLKYCHLSRKYD